MPLSLENLLDRLDESKRRFDSGSATRSLSLLRQLDARRFKDAAQLARFHEALLFMRAYPQGARVLARVEKILNSFSQRVRDLIEAGADISPLEYAEISGISGTIVEDTFSYAVVRWLVNRYPSKISLNWEGYEDEYRLGATWPRFLPLLEEDASVEAHVPYQEWLRAAVGRAGKELPWLIGRFESLPLSWKEKAELYESLKLLVRWELGDSHATRTLMRGARRKVFYHTAPLLARRDVSLTREFDGEEIPLERLSRGRGETLLDLARETSTVRYRELYGFTHGDPSRALRADLGRGVELYLVGAPPERRLPLRAYHAALIFKNGVPVCYVEGLSLFERMEIGFNIYYTFREGESAWIYARVMKIFRQALGVTVFSVDPYQLGYENEEGIESGAFWFYRKLGFRPTLKRVAELMNAEERKLAARPSYRTPARVLRRLVEGNMVLETGHSHPGLWDSFQVRNLGLAVQRRMAGSFGGDSEKMRRAAAESVGRALGVRPAGWKESEKRAFRDLALVLSLIPDLSRWTKEEKDAAARVIRAKAEVDESRYLLLMQRHGKLRDHWVRLGS